MQNKLTILSLHHITQKHRKFFLCKCECGNEVIVSIDKLNSGHTKSCGCLKKKTAASHPSWKGYEEISQSFWSKLQSHAKERGRKVKINMEYAWKKFLSQNRKCALSGLELKFNKNRKSSEGTASLDRIDSSKDYEEGNVQWVHKHINKMKQSFNDEYFIQMCQKVTENNIPVR